MPEPLVRRALWGRALAVLGGVLLVGAYYLWPLSGLPVAGRSMVGGPLLALSEAFFVLAGGVLLGGALAMTSGGQPEALAPRTCAMSLLLQVGALLAGGAAAQGAWGAYWSWDPLECWRLSLCMVTAGVSLGVGGVPWSGRRAALALWLAAGFSLLTLFAAGALTRWLGLSSLYGAW